VVVSAVNIGEKTNLKSKSVLIIKEKAPHCGAFYTVLALIS
jgi:hypothetical protein